MHGLSNPAVSSQRQPGSDTQSKSTSRVRTPITNSSCCRQHDWQQFTWRVNDCTAPLLLLLLLLV
jgi:hypothetical protein